MIINIQDDILILHNHGVLKRLLEDKSTKKNIMWATDAYCAFGERYFRNEEIKPELITGMNSDIIKTRARKELEQQSKRTRQHAEVFTPLWMCKMMNDNAERFWFESTITKDNQGEDQGFIEAIINNDRLFKKYIDSKRLEITCGEAPFLVSRYDVATGEMIPVDKRIGILDRKLQAIGRHAKSENEWLKWVIRAYQSTFGYEFQGDNVLIARVNLLMTFDEFIKERWDRRPTDKEYEKLANIISWNIWQMDGLTGTIPYSKAENHIVQLDIFGLLRDEEEAENEETICMQPYCRIYDWHNKKRSIEFQELRKGIHMKFDFIIGNPPYQEEKEGTSDSPIYNYFMDEAYNIGDVVELITPARFLFKAGKTPKQWNEKMLTDEHLKVLYYEPNAVKVFPNTDIKGGVAVTYRDANKEFGAIEVFTAYEQLNSILHKVTCNMNKSLSEIVFAPESYKFTNVLYQDHPEIKEMTFMFKGKEVPLISKGHDYDLTSNIFEKLENIVFFSTKPSDDKEYVQIFGRLDNKRAIFYIDKRYIADHPNLDRYKLFFPKSNGSGKFGEPMSASSVGTPQMGHTQTFLSMGDFHKEEEASNLMKYVQTKFARTLLGILKVTQDNKKGVWKYVPLLDFSNNSDIDWSQSIPNIDRQLYSRYGLDQNEIDFIESHVKEMK